MKVLGLIAVKYVLPAVIVLLLLAVSGSFMMIRMPGGPGRACGSGAVIYDSIAPACFPGGTGVAGYTSSSTVVTVVGGTFSSSLINLVLPADQYPA